MHLRPETSLPTDRIRMNMITVDILRGKPPTRKLARPESNHGSLGEEYSMFPNIGVGHHLDNYRPTGNWNLIIVF